jgi:hypothetical protein
VHTVISIVNRVKEVSAMLTGPHEMIEDENTCNEAQNENHKVYVVLHAYWSYDQWCE